jgi:hypothetical protein
MSVFKMSTTSAGAGNFEVPPAGNWPAVLVAMIDLGSHDDRFNPGKSKRQVYLTWEVETEEEGGEVKRFVMGERYTASLNEKANLRKVVNALRGKPLGDDEDIDVLDLLGKSCMVEVVHQENGDKTYANVGAVSSLPRKMAPLEPEHEPFSWELASAEPPPSEAWLPRVYGRKVAEVIASCRERAGAAAGASGDTIPF